MWLTKYVQIIYSVIDGHTTLIVEWGVDLFSFTIDNREGEGGLETRICTYGDVTDDVPFGYRPHIRKFRDTILPYIVCCIAIILSPFFLVLPRGCYLSR